MNKTCKTCGWHTPASVEERALFGAVGECHNDMAHPSETMLRVYVAGGRMLTDDLSVCDLWDDARIVNGIMFFGSTPKDSLLQ